jgi:hypothetical protein
MAVDGGVTFLNIASEWDGNLRWARNVVTSGGDRQSSTVSVMRTIRGASSNGMVSTNSLDDTKLEATVRRAEQMVLL